MTFSVSQRADQVRANSAPRIDRKVRFINENEALMIVSTLITDSHMVPGPLSLDEALEEMIQQEEVNKQALRFCLDETGKIDVTEPSQDITEDLSEHWISENEGAEDEPTPVFVNEGDFQDWQAQMRRDGIELGRHERSFAGRM